jgi:FlaA1/EpsC-like NDP-sugar epimerase
VLGTQCLIQVAEQTDVERFVLISTDKAVNPTSLLRQGEGVTR